jgi:hypothetical protein
LWVSDHNLGDPVYIRRYTVERHQINDVQKISIGTRHSVNIGVTMEQTKMTETTDISEFKYDRSVDTSSSSIV